MIFQAEYDFISEHQNILCFKKNERFVCFGRNSEIREGWIYVIDSDLKCGYVPETYVKQLDQVGDEVDGVSFIVQLRDKAILAAKASENNNERDRYLRIFVQLEERLNSNDTPSSDRCNGLLDEGFKSCSTPEDPTPAIPKLASDHATTDAVDGSSLESIPNLLGCELIEHVKQETSLGHKQARAAVEAVLDFLGDRLPSVRALTMAITMSVKGTVPLGEVLENCHDWQRLRTIFSTILDVKSDVEQLNWALYEDQHIIIEFLEELISLLSDGDPIVCKRFLQKDQYRNVEALVQYFHMEVRPAIRQILLKVFATLCTLDRLSITVLVNSDLPLLLAQDIKESNQDLQKLTYSCLLLTMLMWTGETMPLKHYDVLNADFVTYLLDLMDNPTSDDKAEQIADSCTELLLAFNLQFRDPSTNVVTQSLKCRSTAKEFLEKLIVLLNREDDPVGTMFDHSQPPTNAVHKMLLNILGLQETASLFYTNDLKVLIEIVGRKLLDLAPDDKVQHAYLLLAYNIICNTNYSECCHCLDEFQQCFQKIMHEDTSSPEESKKIVEELFSKFPALFRAT